MSKNKIKSNIHYTCNITPKRVKTPRLVAGAKQLRRNVAAVASRWRHCVDLTSVGIEPQSSCTDEVCVTTNLTGRHNTVFTKMFLDLVRDDFNLVI